jgi:hypothetical protein
LLGLDPGIHVLEIKRPTPKEGVDGRIKPGHSDLEMHQFRAMQPNLLNRTAVEQARPQTKQPWLRPSLYGGCLWPRSELTLRGAVEAVADEVVDDGGGGEGRRAAELVVLVGALHLDHMAQFFNDLGVSEGRNVAGVLVA